MSENDGYGAAQVAAELTHRLDIAPQAVSRAVVMAWLRHTLDRADDAERKSLCEQLSATIEVARSQ